MSVEAMTWAFQQDSIPTTARFVLVVLANRANEEGQCWPGLGDIQRRTGLSERAIQKALKLMREAGLLEVTARHADDGRQYSNLYRLVLNYAVEGAPRATVPPNVVRGEGVRRATVPPNVVRGEGVRRAPKSSSEQSEESSSEQSEESLGYGQVKMLPVVRVSSATWEAYAEAYRRRYGVDPVRNAQVNAMLCRLVQKLGGAEAPVVAAFYVTHNHGFYVSKRHPVNLLVQDAEGLRTQWATGVKATMSEVRQAEFVDDAQAQVRRVEAMLAAGAL